MPAWGRSFAECPAPRERFDRSPGPHRSRSRCRRCASRRPAHRGQLLPVQRGQRCELTPFPVGCRPNRCAPRFPGEAGRADEADERAVQGVHVRGPFRAGVEHGRPHTQGRRIRRRRLATPGPETSGRVLPRHRYPPIPGCGWAAISRLHCSAVNRPRPSRATSRCPTNAPHTSHPGNGAASGGSGAPGKEEARRVGRPVCSSL